MRAARLASALASLFVALPCSAQRIGPSDFAYGLELTGDSERPLHAFELPERVLSALVDRELGDLCVFDVHGEQLAHGISPARERSEEASQIAVTSYFPLEAQSEAHTGDVEVTVQRDPSGSITRAYSRPVVAASTRVTGYLIDLSQLAPLWSFEALTLPLHAEQDFSVQVVLETSEDLGDFRPLTNSTLARFERDGQTLRRDVMEFPSTRAPYFRISFLEPPTGLALEGMQVRVRAVAPALERRVIELAASPLASTSDQLFLFALKGAFRPDRYDLALPASTALIEAELESGPTEVGPFHELDRALFRRGGKSERSLASSEDAFFRLRVANKGGGVHDGAPTLRLGYLPPRLLLAPEGKGPYLLAYGSGSARCKQFDEAALRSLAKGELPQGDTLRIVRTRTLGGEELRAKPEQSRSPRVFVLWAVLLVAVGVLALIARKLISKV